MPDANHPLEQYGWTERVATLLADHIGQRQEAGRVVRVDRGFAQLETAGGRRAVAIEPGIDIAAGDWVAVDDVAITAVAPRWSMLARRDPGERVEAQAVAANMDLVLLAHPLDRPFRPRRLERELVLVWESGATPVAVLTKADLGDDPAAITAEADAVAPGVDVIVVSAANGDGVDALRARIGPGVTAALIGPSGAGKSTLVNALVRSDVMPTGAVRAGDSRGRHTTTARYLIPLPGGGVLLDTPGMRAVALWADSDEGMALAFPDVEGLAAECRFRDCQHNTEPDCAVQAAIEAGTLDRARFRSWRRLQTELDDTAAARVERARKLKTLHKQFRNQPHR